MMRGCGWTLELIALIIVGSALLIGLFYDALRVEVAMLGIGSVIFLIGRRLENSNSS